LNFKPTIGAVAEQKANNRVAATDGARDKNSPHGKNRKAVVDAINGMCNFDECFHEFSVLTKPNKPMILTCS
jgi:hypothetical protein